MITVAIVTLSDKGSKGERQDTSGPLIRDLLNRINAGIRFYDILPMKKSRSRQSLSNTARRLI
jgi:molybdopterin biosynthesis enzyme MoaB